MVGHGTCSVCGKRIKSNEYKRKLGTPSFWMKAKAYAGTKGLPLTEDDIACKKCHICILTGKTNGIKTILQKSPNALFENCNNESPSQSVSNTSMEDHADFASIENEVANPMELQECSQISSSITENSINSQSSTGSLNSFVFSMPKPIIKIEIPSCSGTQKRCFICGAYERSRIPKSAIVDIWFKRKIIIPFHNRACKEHIGVDKKFVPDIVEHLVCSKENITLSADEIKEFLMTISEVPPNVFSTLLDFSEQSSLSSNDYEKLTGISKENFHNLHDYCSRLKNSANRSTRDALAMLLIKLRLNLPQEIIAILFGTTQERVSDAIKSVRICLEETFVPKYLGFQHLSREDAKIHQSKFANKLFKAADDVYFIVIDATYLYIQKPSDFDMQKKTYCLHKKRNLLKPMICAFPDGYILDCTGLFYCDSENNDANILSCMLDISTEFPSFFHTDDHVIVDRGFRDVIEKLRLMKYKPFMPHLLSKGEKQFSTKDANESRFVTMLRWVIEAVNGRLKNKFRMFASVIEATYIPVLGSLFRIGCAIINAYSPPLFTEKDDHNKLAEDALERINKTNELMNYVETEGLMRKTACWRIVSKEDFQDFPILNEYNLRSITLGTYQVHLAYMYTKKHLSKDSSYKIYVHKVMPTLIRAKIESRFFKSSHQIWISYEPNENSEKGVKSWYCTCKVGSRIVGCCSHVASILWFLGYARHNDAAIRDRRSLCDNILDAACAINNGPSEVEDE